MKRSLLARVGLLMAFAGALCQAQETGLKWEKPVQKIETFGPGQKKELEYRFSNASGSALTILSATASCGCTVPNLPEKKLYAPGESGVLQVTHVSKGGGSGLQTYRITVQTDEQGGVGRDLELQVSNTPRIEADPRMLTWEQGEARSAKTITLRLKAEDTLKITGARAQTADVVEFQLLDGTQPNEKLLRVTPKNGGSSQARTRFRLLTEPQLPISVETEFFAVLR